MTDIVHSVYHTVITDEKALENKQQRLNQMWSDEYQQHMKKQTQKQHQERRKTKAQLNEQPKMKSNDSEAQQEGDLLKLEGS